MFVVHDGLMFQDIILPTMARAGAAMPQGRIAEIERIPDDGEQSLQLLLDWRHEAAQEQCHTVRMWNVDLPLYNSSDGEVVLNPNGNVDLWWFAVDASRVYAVDTTEGGGLEALVGVMHTETTTTNNQQQQQQ